MRAKYGYQFDEKVFMYIIEFNKTREFEKTFDSVRPNTYDLKIFGV